MTTTLSPEFQAAVNLDIETEQSARKILDARHRKPDKPKADIDWTAGLRKNSKGASFGDEANVLHALRNAPELRGCSRWNEFENRLELARSVHWRDATVGERWTDADDLDVMAWMQKADIPVRGRNTVADAVARVARDDPYHPVRDYLDDLEWDGGGRLHNWLSRYLGADANEEYLAAVGTAFLVSAVARIYEPGCQADHVLVLEGKQGVGKTRTLQTLGYPWTTDSLPDLHSKDAAVQLHGVWLVELAELAALRRSETEATKAFISRRVDRYRPPYGRHAVEVPRQCVFVATTNEATYLRDPTGNRRFWPTRITDVDLDGLERDRDLLWAEAVELYRKGQPWHLTGDDAETAGAEQDKRQHRTETEQAITDYLDRLEDSGVFEVTTKQVFENALSLTLPEDALKARRFGVEVANAITNCGWERQGVHGRGTARRVLYVLPHRDS